MNQHTESHLTRLEVNPGDELRVICVGDHEGCDGYTE